MGWSEIISTVPRQRVKRSCMLSLFLGEEGKNTPIQKIKETATPRVKSKYHLFTYRKRMTKSANPNPNPAARHPIRTRKTPIAAIASTNRVRDRLSHHSPTATGIQQIKYSAHKFRSPKVAPGVALCGIKASRSQC